jgi:TRAP-type mannitol/chloroaromatic compound transport system permease small subunit
MTETVAKRIRLVRVIDRITDATGVWVAWLNVPLVAAVAYEVVSRYVFDKPTEWSYDVTYMLYSAIFMLGAAYALHKGAHIRTDFFYANWTERTRGVVDSISYIVFFFPSIFMLLVASWGEAWYAYTINETSEQTTWRPLLWPFKAVVPLTCAMLLLQGISELIKSLHAARTGIVLEHKEKIEL